MNHSIEREIVIYPLLLSHPHLHGVSLPRCLFYTRTLTRRVGNRTQVMNAINTL